MKSPFAISVLVLLFLVTALGCFNLGESQQTSVDQLRITTLQAQNSQLSQANMEMDASIRKLSYEAKTNAWEKYFAAQQQVNDLQQQVAQLQDSNAGAIQGIRGAYRQLTVCEETVAQARQAQATQGMDAAMKVLALLLR
jgi:cell division protein FtsB